MACASYRDHRTETRPGRLVDRPRHLFLARPRFPLDQYRGRGLSDTADQVKDGMHVSAFAEDILEGVAALQILAHRGNFNRQVKLIQRPLDEMRVAISSASLSDRNPVLTIR